ncbi:serine/threonine-protein kinase [Nocardioides dubius]|uniref:non-specific serine/threonine protein kinase n=1 Tax=Nocardioides dubius TaxID=317019 RepID=A0ABP4E303_9ACTN
MSEFFAGRFELLDPIASGGMGTVWRVRDAHDGQIKAAKILQQSDAGSLLRFMREQSMRIDHRHVVTPLSWAGMDDRVLFTMPIVHGGSVADLIREHGALPVRWAAELIDQLLQALEAVHGAGIVHRDVKPANLLLEPTGTLRPHLRLTDFGIAAPVDEPRMTRASMAIGTPGYMAPEQWHGADPDPRADLYSVAAVAVEMVTGSRPPAVPEPPPLGTPETGSPQARFLELLRPALGTPAERPPSAAQLRADLAASGLLDLPAEPGESIRIGDRYGSTLDEPTQVPGVGATRLDPAASTRLDRRGTAPLVAAGPGSSRQSPLPGLLLILVGLLALAGAVLLW